MWCKIRSCDLKIPLATRRHSEARSLQSLKSDHNKFMLETSGDIKRAKEYFNCIGEPFFSIPIQQVIHNACIYMHIKSSLVTSDNTLYSLGLNAWTASVSRDF